MTIATIIVMAICIKLGLWQYHKAQEKIALQQQLEQGLASASVPLPKQINQIEDWRYKRVQVTGIYEPKYQILLDNQVNNNVVGYHVITPLKIDGQAQYVLVNRGWVKGNLNREIPAIETPTGRQTLEGDLFFPLSKFFTLAEPTTKEIVWEKVWQHIDMKQYKTQVPFDVKPYVIRLDPKSTAGGFSRNWPIPKDRITVHLGYAYQWFGFALTLFVIYIVLNLKRVNKES